MTHYNSKSNPGSDTVWNVVFKTINHYYKLQFTWKHHYFCTGQPLPFQHLHTLSVLMIPNLLKCFWRTTTAFYNIGLQASCCIVYYNDNAVLGGSNFRLPQKQTCSENIYTFWICYTLLDNCLYALVLWTLHHVFVYVWYILCSFNH